MSCRRQGMLTEGPAPDPKCKLNISSFLIHPHWLDCLICTRNSMFIVFLVWKMGGWDRWEGGWFIPSCGWGDKGWVLSHGFFSFGLLSFGLSCPVSLFMWAEHDSCCVCLFVYYFFSYSPVSLSRSYWEIEIVVSVI